MGIDTDSATLNRLLAENEEFKKLHAEHILYGKQINEINRKKHLTPEDETEMVRLKKLKLHAKDRMEKIAG
jgi:hypothetical protein